MDHSQRETLQRIQDHALDIPGASLTFSGRLARENGWTREYADLVIDEYRRFCFLAAHAGHPVTPSDAVDQVWHLHLTYTRDYWGIFCPDVLGFDFHHGPTKGGPDEAAKYDDWYSQTLASYSRFFGAPPRTVWPAPHARFRNVDRFQRINTADDFILSRKVVRNTGLALGGFGLLSTAGGAAAAEGGAVLAGLVFVSMIILAGIIVFAIARNASGGGSRQKRGCGYVGAPAGGVSSSGKKADADADGGSDGGGDGGSGCGGGCGGA